MARRFLSYSLDRDYLIDLLSALYGLGSWIAMTGLWVELPVLTPKLPEGWSLASHLSVVLQFANVACIIYGIGRKYWPGLFNEISGTHGQMAIGTLSCILLIPFWSHTVGNHSIALYVLSFGLSIVDCVSSIVFVPYMARFPVIYMTPYLIGESLSGLIPSLVAMVQGIENVECLNVTVKEGNNTIHKMVPFVPDPRFSPEIFFTILLLMVTVSWFSFCVLNYSPYCREKMVLNPQNHNQLREENDLKCVENKPSDEIWELREPLSDKANGSETKKLNQNAENRKSKYIRNNTPISKAIYLYLLFLQTWASMATFGIFPAIQPYSCLPYGNQEFHLTVTLCGVAYPAACILALFVEVKSLNGISTLTLLATIISFYLMATAAFSPFPPLVNSTVGSVIIVSSWVFFSAIFSYVKTMIAILLRDGGSDKLFWYGAVTQIGAVAGAVVMFLLINVGNVLQDDKNCLL